MAPMTESITLATPETKPANPKYDISGIRERWLPVGQESFEVELLGQNGEVRTVLYGPLGLIGPTGLVVAGSPTGKFLLDAQNKMNFSVNSRRKRIYQQLTADGVLVGTVTGTPD
jgi:hypothetical protein